MTTNDDAPPDNVVHFPGSPQPEPPEPYLLLIEDVVEQMRGPGHDVGVADQYRHHMVAVNQVLGWAQQVDCGAFLDQLDEALQYDLTSEQRALLRKVRNTTMALESFKKLIGA